MRQGDPTSPGWYPDPVDSHRMRRWDGRRWTGESKPIPTWAAGGSTATRRRRIGSHWYVFGGVVALMFVITLTKAFFGRPDLPPRTVYDKSFIAAANTECRGELARLKAERPKPGTKEAKNPGSEEKVAAQVEDVADRLAHVVGRLRDIPVAADDQADVNGWLDQWDQYISLGHQYADAVRRKDSGQVKLVNDGAKIGQRATLFAQANKLDDCTIA